MNDLIEVRVNLLEFTYRDEKGYHTVVGYGKVSRDNPQVQEALKKGWLEEVKPVIEPSGDGKAAASSSSGKKK